MHQDDDRASPLEPKQQESLKSLDLSFSATFLIHKIEIISISTAVL